jgi:alpha-mannosidase
LRNSRHAALLQNALSTRIWIKQRSHNCETDLLKWVEPLNAIINLLDFKASSADGSIKSEQMRNNRDAFIQYAWKLLMQCHPHDSICGTTIDQVSDEIRVRFDQVDQINYELINQFLFKVSEHIDTNLQENQLNNQGQAPLLSTILVFNPNDSSQTGLVTQKIKFENHTTAFDIIDNHGISIPFEQSGMGVQELISMKLDPKGLKQALGMLHEGHAAGMIIRNFTIESHETNAIIYVTLSEQGEVDLIKWKRGISQLGEMLADPNISEYLIHAYSDPETDISFVARDVPGHGYQCYWIRDLSNLSAKQPGQARLNPIIRFLLPVLSFVSRIPLVSRLASSRGRISTPKAGAIENEFYIVRVDSSDSTISIFDKRSGKLYSGMNHFLDDGDCGDVYNYCPPKNNINLAARITGIERIEKKIYQQLIITYLLKIPSGLSNDRTKRNDKYVNNRIKSTVTLVAGVPRVDVRTEVDNLARDHRLRVHFPASFNATNAFYDGHFEIISRPIGTPDYDETWEEPPRPEVPQRKFTAITNGHNSMIIANRGLPEVEVYRKDDDKSVIAITLLRSIGWLSRDDLTTRKGHAGPMGVTTPQAQMIGKYTFDYSIIPLDGNWRNAIPLATSFNASLRPIPASIHQGDLASQGSFIENQNPAFIITAVKQPEDHTGVIIRGYNILASPIDIELKVWVLFKHAQLVSLSEKFISDVPINRQGSISLHVDGNKNITLRLSD